VGGLFKEKEKTEGARGKIAPSSSSRPLLQQKQRRGRKEGAPLGGGAPGHGSGRGVGENREEAEGVRFPFLPWAEVERGGLATEAGGRRRRSTERRRWEARKGGAQWGRVVGMEGAVEGLFIGAERRWRRGAAVVADGQLCSAPSMAWGQLRLLAGVVERRGLRGRRPGAGRARGRLLWPTSSLARAPASRRHRRWCYSRTVRIRRRERRRPGDVTRPAAASGAACGTAA